jgi:hypothetical protein
MRFAETNCFAAFRSGKLRMANENRRYSLTLNECDEPRPLWLNLGRRIVCRKRVASFAPMPSMPLRGH